MADEKDLRILNVSFSHGSVHDFRLFCRSRVYFSKDVLLIADKGYIGIEHVNRHIKRFRIVSTRYRNKRRKFALRFSLICAIYNFEL